MKLWESGRESALLDDIIAGRKTIEGRLDRGKFAEYQVGDKVWLRRDYRDEGGQLRDGEPRQALVEIIAIRHYSSMREMVDTEGYEHVIPSARSLEDAIAEYDKYYSPQDQAKYGVLAIEFKVLPPTRWDEFYETGVDFGQMRDEMVAKIAGFISHKPNPRALDIGCGTGRLTRQLKANGFRVVGIDPARVGIKLAIEQDGGIDYRIGGIEAVEGEVFDLVICKQVYAFVDDKLDFLHRVKACVSSEGRFVLIAPTFDQAKPEEPGIYVDRTELIHEVSQFFTIELQHELPAGLMLVLKTK